MRAAGSFPVYRSPILMVRGHYLFGLNFLHHFAKEVVAHILSTVFGGETANSEYPSDNMVIAHV